MGSLNPENLPKQEFDDSGYVQEDATGAAPSAETPVKSTPSLLDLSDDVLLDIFKYCSPSDLKALGYTCPRLGTVILDRTLWQQVDAREVPTGKKRMRWLLTHALSVHTTTLMLSGFAKEAKGCMGYMSGSKDEDAENVSGDGQPGDHHPLNLSSGAPVDDEPILMRLSAQALPRYGGGFPYWPESDGQPSSTRAESPPPERTGHRCPGPQVTLTKAALLRLTALCTNLRELALEHVIIDCNMTKISMFPVSLRKLSLLGTKCFNLKSFLYKIQDRLVHLEDLDVSQCEWVEPACMLPLSKMSRLRRLVMRDCPKLSEFVAYASLATRYGFKTLRILDLRGSPVGDSEVSALGWVPHLEELYLSPAAQLPRHADHAHFSRDPPPRHTELSHWEKQEPEYYKTKYASEKWVHEELKHRPYRNVSTDDNAVGSCVLLQHVVSEPAAVPYSRVRSREYCGPGINRTSYSREYLRDDQAQLTRGEQILADARREREREREEARITASMGYILSSNGCRRTINMYPDVEMESDEEILINSEETYKRKQKNGGESGPVKRVKETEGDCDETGMKNEPGSSKSSSAKRLGSKLSSSNNEAGALKDESDSAKNEPDSSNNESGSSKNEPNSSKNEPKEPCVTKASRKYFDDPSCQISRIVLKDSLSDFKKRTQGFQGPLYKLLSDQKKSDFFHSDDDDHTNMDKNDDDDDDDDDKPQPKRGRVIIAGGTSNRKIEAKVEENQPSTSSNNSNNPPQQPTPQPSCSKVKPSHSTTKPSQQSAVPSHSNDELKNNENKNEELSLPSTSSEISDNINQLVISKCALLQDQPGPSFNRPNVDNEPGHSSKSENEPGHSSKSNNEPGRSSKTDNEPGHSSKSNNKPGHSSELNEPSHLPKLDEPSHPSKLNSEPGHSNNESDHSAKEPGQPTNEPGRSTNEPTNDSGYSTNDSGQPSTRKGGNEPQKFVRFRHNEPPVVIQGCSAGCSTYSNNFNIYNNNDSQEPDWNRRDPMICGVPDLPDQRLEIDPGYPSGSRSASSNAIEPNIPEENASNNDLRRHRILYVNVGRRRHAMYQISMAEPVDLSQRPNTAHMNLIYSSQIPHRLEYTSLVTDAAIRRFGRADGDNINYVNIGPMGQVAAPYDDPHARPNRSNLRVLSVTGFRNVTNYSLSHLVTAAPRLEFVDFTGTRVSAAGVEHFRSFRPSCYVRYGPVDKEDTERSFNEHFRPHSR